jgi:outer membrane lipopolysaccharide assembly protein LptE/RlpB
MMRIALYTLLLSLSAALVSCGYSMSGSGGLVNGSTGKYRTIAIPMFANDTYEPLVEREVTSALKEEVAYDGRLSLVDEADADLVVEGRIVEVDLQPLTFDAADRIQEYRIRIVAEVKVMEPSGESPVWKDSRMESFADYRVTQDVTKSKINKSEAIKKAYRNFAENFVIKVLEIL